MKIFVDENIPARTVRELRHFGHELMDIRGTDKEGISDEEVWQLVQKEGRLLITTDKGFAQKRYERHNGILIVKLKQPNRIKIHQKVMHAMGILKENEWTNTTVVIQDTFHSVWKAKKEKVKK